MAKCPPCPNCGTSHGLTFNHLVCGCFVSCGECGFEGPHVKRETIARIMWERMKRPEPPPDFRCPVCGTGDVHDVDSSGIGHCHSCNDPCKVTTAVTA